MLVTGTVTLVASAAKLTVGGILITVGSLELRLIVNPPAGAGADKFNARFCDPMPVMVTLWGKKLSVSATVIGATAVVKPGAAALIVADPNATPLNCGAVSGLFRPAAMTTVAGVTATLAGSLAVRLTTTPSGGAGVGKVIAKGADAPSPTVS